MAKKYNERDPLDEVRRAYWLFVGDDPSGKISVRSLRKVAKELNENLSEEELQALIDEFDNDQDGFSELSSQRERVHPDHDAPLSLQEAELNLLTFLNNFQQKSFCDPAAVEMATPMKAFSSFLWNKVKVDLANRSECGEGIAL